jgi:hypothetical protein
MRLIASLLLVAVLTTSCATTQPRQQAPQSQPVEASDPPAPLGALTAWWWARRLRSRINSSK